MQVKWERKFNSITVVALDNLSASYVTDDNNIISSYVSSIIIWKMVVPLV